MGKSKDPGYQPSEFARHRFPRVIRSRLLSCMVQVKDLVIRPADNNYSRCRLFRQEHGWRGVDKPPAHALK